MSTKTDALVGRDAPLAPVAPAPQPAPDQSKPDQPKKHTWFGYFKSGEDQPIAVVRDDAADFGQAVRANMPTADQIDVVPVPDLNVNVPQGVKDHLKAQHNNRNPQPTVPSDTLDDATMGQLRNEVAMNRKRDAAKKQIEAELDKADADAKKPEADAKRSDPSKA